MDHPRDLDDLLAPARGFMHLEDEYTDFARARAVVLPIPFDATTCYRPGTREGPQAIIDASRNLELYDPELRRSPYRAGIHTLRAVEPIMGDAQAMTDRIERITSRLLESGKLLVMLGGDHSTTIGVVRAFAKRHPQMSVLQLDAHADLREEYEGNALSSATIMRRVLDVCPRTAQVGIRSLSEPEAELVAARALPMWLASAIHQRGLAGDREWIPEVVSALSEEVYVTIDIDVFDPSLVPGTGTPEPGGLGWYEVMDLLAAVAASKRIIGFDVVEVSPLVEGHVSPVVAAKVVYKLLGLALPPTPGA
ncbi:MAG TPA: agmatinase [Ktedonobacterales bacterium]